MSDNVMHRRSSSRSKELAGSRLVPIEQVRPCVACRDFAGPAKQSTSCHIRRRIAPAVLLAAVALFIFVAAMPRVVNAQTRRALLVGINTYTPPEGTEPTVSRKWRDLEGSTNDVETMRAILSDRFGFEQVTTLTDREATRDAIFNTIADELVAKSDAGDIVVFFYAGHGSQVRNTGTKELDGLDETIVPADAWQGAPDIRDKELRDAFNELLERDVHVTLIFDSCHSGSITRGIQLGKSRYIEPSPMVVSDPEDPPDPVQRGAVVISAAQDDEVARELEDESGNPRGAFTWALARALESYKPTESVAQLFQSARAILRSTGATQEPVLAAQSDRQRMPFLGTVAAASTELSVPVVEVEVDGSVVLQGGLATGLRAGATLVREGADDSGAIRLEVIESDGLARSVATVTSGSDLPRSGDVFKVEKWVSGAATPLRLFVPTGTTTLAEIQEAYARLSGGSDGITWVGDPTDIHPNVFVFWSNGTWMAAIAGPDGSTPVSLGPSPDASDVKAAAASAGVDNVTVFVSLPPFAEFGEQFGTRLGSLDASVEFVDSPEKATYVLAGRPPEGQLDDGIEYAWVLRAATGGESVSPAPDRSDWHLATPNRLFASAILSRDVNRLNVIWGWLNLTSPPDDGTFPYTFGGFESVADGSRRFAGDTLRVGERYRLVLETTFADLEKSRVAALMKRADRRYVYFFVMDRGGGGYLLYPAAELGNVENDIVLFSDLSTEIRIPGEDGVLFEVAEPVGIDSFFLITSAQPIPQPDILNFEGVRTRGPASGEQTELSRLFYALGSGTRGAKQPVPTSWSMERITVHSVR